MQRSTAIERMVRAVADPHIVVRKSQPPHARTHEHVFTMQGTTMNAAVPLLELA